jgi:ABC-type iron transport system FetAB permease component
MNEVFGWAWILVGLASGVALGLGFHREGWLDGYGSLRRRMLRLGHVSLVALGAMNLLYATTAPRLALSPALSTTAAWSWIFGAVSMPACCALMAWRPALRPCFALPIASLLLGATLVILGLSGR